MDRGGVHNYINSFIRCIYTQLSHYLFIQIEFKFLPNSNAKEMHQHFVRGDRSLCGSPKKKNVYVHITRSLACNVYIADCAQQFFSSSLICTQRRLTDHRVNELLCLKYI